jgi:OCT family organic cation transporter-like MFS transporter 4/5
MELGQTHTSDSNSCFRIAVALMYFGVTMNARNIGGNFYLNFFLNAIVEFPALWFVIMTMDRIGRKKLQCLVMVFGGVATMCTIFTVIFGGDGKKSCTA